MSNWVSQCTNGIIEYQQILVLQHTTAFTHKHITNTHQSTDTSQTLLCPAQITYISNPLSITLKYQLLSTNRSTLSTVHLNSVSVTSSVLPVILSMFQNKPYWVSPPPPSPLASCEIKTSVTLTMTKISSPRPFDMHISSTVYTHFSELQSVSLRPDPADLWPPLISETISPIQTESYLQIFRELTKLHFIFCCDFLSLWQLWAE